KNKNRNYLSLPLYAQDHNAIKKGVEDHQLQQADEIWASYSVPYYLSSPDEISDLFQTIKESLAENGIARITPIAIQGEDPEMYIKSKETFIDQIRILAGSPEYNVYAIATTAGTTMFIEKLLQEK
ncbi:MAG: hypothetical protein WCO03_02135, partial [bacterium]